MKVKKVRRRKFNFKKFFKFLLFLCITISITYYISKEPLRNIIIKGNYLINDDEIIEKSGLLDYPSFINTSKKKIKNKIKTIPIIKDVTIKKKWGYILEINIKEYNILFKIRSSGEYVLDEDLYINELNYNTQVPILINYVPSECLNKMIKKFKLLENDNLQKISEIEYSPTTFDDERFILYMKDGNEVYITLNKINELNNYTKIKRQLGDKKGILYLDSGNYFEIKE